MSVPKLASEGRSSWFGFRVRVRVRVRVRARVRARVRVRVKGRGARRAHEAGVEGLLVCEVALVHRGGPHAALVRHLVRVRVRVRVRARARVRVRVRVLGFGVRD